jgi:hypothetical protein
MSSDRFQNNSNDLASGGEVWSLTFSDGFGNT